MESHSGNSNSATFPHGSQLFNLTALHRVLTVPSAIWLRKECSPSSKFLPLRRIPYFRRVMSLMEAKVYKICLMVQNGRKTWR